MKKLIEYLFVTALLALMFISANAKEVVVYENDFSFDYLDEFTSNGSWVVSDGVLKTGTGTGTAYLYYDIPDVYDGCNYRVDVDFIGHTSTGGISIGAAGDTVTGTPSLFHGFDCFTGGNGKKAALGCYKADGSWSGNIVVGSDIITASDIHFSVEVYDNELTFTVTSLDGKTTYYGVTYTLGTNTTRDIYSAFTGNIALRKFYTDKGAFDNLKVTVYEEDELPSLGKTVDLDGFGFKSSNGLKLSSGAVSGSGAMLTQSALADNFKASLTLTPENNSKVFFGMKDNNNGYAFEINRTRETVAFYQITNGEYIRLGVKNAPVYDGEHTVTVEVTDSVATVTFDAFFEGEDAFKSFDFKLTDYAGGKFGVWLEGGNVKNLSVTETDGITGETYTNPVAWGADPDVLFYDGTYYLYNRIHSGNDIFRVYTSPDLVRWTARSAVFSIDDSFTTTGYMSPNVFYHDGIFYLFYAAKNTDGKNRLFYATSDSPYGPFTHKNGQTALHDVSEIGGHPYYDADSGKIYISYVRFDNGNHIYLEEITLNDGVFAVVPGTLTKVISPTHEYEIDGYGHISEGGVLYKHNGYYYMIYAAGHYQGHYGEAYAVAENILGPYTKYEYNEILTSNKHIDGVGDGIFVQSPDGTELWMVYHQHETPGKYSSRYTCIDQVKFVADPEGGPDILTVNGPSTTPQIKPSNIYRYDINRSGIISLYDAMKVLRDKPSTYSGIYDTDCNNRLDEYDAMAIIDELVK
ncbi:MAG: family 43 glycosylhydrolase [Clostridia bacterium]|nr:family 43 glycosylhydrolase [Clostridia bacterium]